MIWKNIVTTMREVPVGNDGWDVFGWGMGVSKESMWGPLLVT